MQMGWLREKNLVCSSDEMSASMRELMLTSFLLLFLGESVHEQLVLRHVHVHSHEVYPIHYAAAAAAHLMPMLLKEDEEEGCQHMLLISLFVIATFKAHYSTTSLPDLAQLFWRAVS